MTVLIPGVGEAEEDDGLLFTEARIVPALGAAVNFFIEGYVPGTDVTALAACIDTFCRLSSDDLRAIASEPVFAYYRDWFTHLDQEAGLPRIDDVADVWDFVDLAFEPWVERRDETWYVVLENGCAWETEHGLMMVLRNGDELIRVAPYDGQLTNRAARPDQKTAADEIYVSPFTGRHPVENPDSA